MPHASRPLRSALAIATALVPLALLGACTPLPSSGTSDLDGLKRWLAARPAVEGVEESTEPAEDADAPDVRVFTVDLLDDADAADVTVLLESLNQQMDGRPGAFSGGRVRLAPIPGVNELTLYTHAETTDGAFADAVAIWFALAEHFDEYDVDLQYVHRMGWATERVSTVDLGGAGWTEAAAALRTLEDVGAFEPDGESSSAWVRLGAPSPWWGDRPAEIGFWVGSGPGDELLAAVEALGLLQGEGVARFDFSSGPWTPDGETLGVLAVVDGDEAAVESADFDAFGASPAWAAATRIVDVLAGHGIPFSLSLKTADETAVPFANLDTETCELTTSPFSRQLTEYWRSVGGAC